MAANRVVRHRSPEVPLFVHGKWSHSHSLKKIAANRRADGGTKWHEVAPNGLRLSLKSA